MPDLSHYLTRFCKLKTSRLGGEEAPYKPALLLAVLEGIEDGSIQDNQIGISAELLAAFQSNCRDLSTSGRRTLLGNLSCTFSLSAKNSVFSTAWHPYSGLRGQLTDSVEGNFSDYEEVNKHPGDVEFKRAFYPI